MSLYFANSLAQTEKNQQKLLNIIINYEETSILRNNLSDNEDNSLISSPNVFISPFEENMSRMRTTSAPLRAVSKTSDKEISMTTSILNYVSTINSMQQAPQNQSNNSSQNTIDTFQSRTSRTGRTKQKTKQQIRSGSANTQQRANFPKINQLIQTNQLSHLNQLTQPTNGFNHSRSKKNERSSSNNSRVSKNSEEQLSIFDSRIVEFDCHSTSSKIQLLQTISQITQVSETMEKPIQYVIEPIIENLNSAVRVQDNAILIAKEIFTLAQRIQICMFPFLTHISENMIDTPTVSKLGGFTIPKTLIDQLQQSFQSYIGLLRDISDNFSSTIELLQNIQNTFQEFHEEPRQKSLAFPSNTNQGHKKKKSQEKNSRTHRSLKTLNQIQFQLDVQQQEICEILSTDTKLLQLIIETVRRVLLIQNQIKVKQATKDFGLAEEQGKHRSRAYSAELLSLESTKLNMLLEKLPKKLFGSQLYSSK